MLPFGVFSPKKYLPQFEENSFVMRQLYKIILVQYDET